MHAGHDFPAHGLLAHVRIVDLCDETGRFCTQLLADLGAEVIRVEFPRNARRPTDRRRIAELAARADVVVESFAPGYLDAMGLGFGVLGESNPALIMASITGFGQTGPRKDDPSCDLVASAAGGQARIGGQTPMAPVGMQAYHTGSLFAAVGVLLALQGRHRDGRGRHIDISLQESVAATLDHVWVSYFHESIITDGQGDRHWDDLFCTLPCKTGLIHLTPLYQWETLVDWLDGEGMADDLKAAAYRDEAYRKARVEHVIDVLARWTRTHSVDELFQLGQLMGFPWAPVCDPAAVLASEQLRARRFFRPSTLHSLSGQTYLNSVDKNKPTGLGFAYADVISGLYCALAVAAALDRRRQTGHGLTIDLSEYEAACSLLGQVLMDPAARDNGQSPSCVENGGTAAAPYGCYPCLGEDRWCAIAVVDGRQWQVLCRLMGDPEWAHDRRFTSMQSRSRHRHELDRRIGAWTRSTTAETLAGRLIAAGIPAGVVADAREVAHDPHLAARGFFVEGRHPRIGPITTDRSPIRFMDEPPPPCRPAPLLGEHNRYVYQTLLGLADGEYEAYLSQGIIR